MPVGGETSNELWETLAEWEEQLEALNLDHGEFALDKSHDDFGGPQP